MTGYVPTIRTHRIPLNELSLTDSHTIFEHLNYVDIFDDGLVTESYVYNSNLVIHFDGDEDKAMFILKYNNGTIRKKIQEFIIDQLEQVPNMDGSLIQSMIKGMIRAPR